MGQKTFGSVVKSIFSSIPWCCVIPGVLSVLGLGGAFFARSVASKLNPVFFFVSVFFIGRAHYLIYRRGKGNRLSVALTWASTLLVAWLWLPRLPTLIQ